jgi:hypothetical protein
MCNKGFSSKSIIQPRSNFGIGSLESRTQSLIAQPRTLAATQINDTNERLIFVFYTISLN